jgi:hypothetical protein
MGARTIIASISLKIGWALAGAFFFFFVLSFFRILLRKEWAGAVAFVIFLSVLRVTGDRSIIALIAVLVVNSLTVFVITRLGLLAVFASLVFQICLLQNFPLTTQASAWYSGISLAGILLMAAMALYGFYTSLGGRPVFGGGGFEE